MRKLFTSESVTAGHPDKLCDVISDSILDAALRVDPESRVACECMAVTGQVHIAGEITTRAVIDYAEVARQAINEIGYTKAEYGIAGDTCGVQVSLDKQSPDIAMGVDASQEAKSGDIAAGETGAGDQGLMFGYACNETPELMPLPISLAHKMAQRLEYVRKHGRVKHLRPDGKTQVTVEYEDGKPKRIEAVVVSTQHDPEVSQKEIFDDMMAWVIKPILPANMLDKDTKYFVNPTGRFVTGGPQGDAGLTGRKIIVDTYGGYARHGGGAFSGKDPSKVDRSACYMARYVAKNVVAAGLADKCEIQLAYAIGVARPVSVMVDTFGTGKLDDDALAEVINKIFPLTPTGIIEHLQLKKPIYKQTAAYGHFGRTDVDLPWEHTDKVQELRKETGLI